MPAQIFGAQAAVSFLNRAFANTSPSNAVYVNQVANATASLPAGTDATVAGNYTAFAKTFGAAYAGQTAAQLSTLLMTNLGLLPNATLETALADYITNAGTGNVGIVALQLASLLSAKEGDATYGAAATAWNNEVTSAFTYSSNTANTTAQVGDTTTTTPTTSTFTLTTSSDLVNGTAADETFNGLVGTNAVNGNLQDTFQSVDIINGGAGTDTLNVSIASATAAVGPTVAGIENIVFTGFVAQDFNMANVTGATSVTNTGSIVAASFTNVGAKVDLAVKNVNNQQTTLSYAATVNAALTDEGKLTLDNVTNEAKITVTGAGTIETLNVATTGTASKVDIGGTALAATSKMVVTGDQTFSFDDFADANGNATVDAGEAMAGLTTLDASALTGKLDADLRNGGAVNLDIKGGTADDSVIITNFTKDDKVDLGAGTDTLTIRSDANMSVTTGASLLNTEIISFALDTGANSAEVSTYSMSGATALTTVKVGAATAGGTDTVNLTNLGATAVNLEVNGGGASTADAVINTVGFALKTASGTADALTITVTNKDANGNAVVPSAKGTQLSQQITANGMESVTINAGTLGANSDNSTALTADGGYKLDLRSDNLKTLTVTSTTLVDLVAGTALDDNLKTIVASGATGGFSADLSLAVDASTTAAGATAAISITTGDGMDFIKTLNGTVNTTVSLGAGNDRLTAAGNWGNGAGAAEAISIDAGTGNDNIDISADATLAAAATKSITLGDGVDTVVLNGNVTQTGVTLADFVAGAGGDKIDLATNASSNGTTALTTFVKTAGAAATDNLTAGMIVLTGTNAASLSIADVVTALTNVLAGDTTDNNEASYIIISNGTDAGLYHYLEGDTVAAVGAGDLVHLATLVGISDTTTLTVDNFTDFLA